ncbi:MAG: DEAD/DEAH box helicase, partial [Clostridiales bacterium]|nr:DEAD/DEAH box helicase [Clostridiales bacterium]
LSVANGEIVDLNCDCEKYKSTFGTCLHIAATAIALNNNKLYQNLFSDDKNNANNVNEKDKYRLFRQMLNSFYNDEQRALNEKMYNGVLYEIKPTLFFDSDLKNIRVEFEIISGNNRYKIKNIVNFYDNILARNVVKYGKKIEFMHCIEAFDEPSKGILKFLMKYAEMIKYFNERNSKYFRTTVADSFIEVSENGMDDLFNSLNGKYVSSIIDNSTIDVKFVDSEPDLKFKVEDESDDEFRISTDEDIYDYTIIPGIKYVYFLRDDKIYRCSREYSDTVLKLLNVFRINFTKEILFPKSEFADFYSLIFPRVKNNLDFDVNREEIEKYKPKELKVKVYFDYDKKGYVLADIKFSYDDFEFNPFEKIDDNISRNMVEESIILDMFSDSGFVFDVANKRLMLVDDKKIFEFLKNDIEKYINKIEVFATDEFKRKQLIVPKITSIGVKIENNLLRVDLTQFNFDKSEIKEIMKDYMMKKSFHRLKNGDFIDLSNNNLEVLQELINGTDIDYEELKSDSISLPVFRGMYLDKIFKKNEIRIKQDENFKTLVDDVKDKRINEKFELPKNLNASLREYQKLGFDWVKTLDAYGLGGILADDMGLGKTLQMLSVILDYFENISNEDNKLPVLVVCPSSLSLNWLEESKKFTPTLKSVVISGDQESRNAIINNINDYNLVITSYDLLKRDLDLYKEKDYLFRYIIADEAQYIKNNLTKNAKAIKEIRAVSRFALTGTPIENSLSELWSIFDFIMPGYLFSYNKFKNSYEVPIIKDGDTQSMNKLKMMIEPFILRRVKEKVLSELPDKTITVLNNEMNDEQKKIYLSFVESARKEISAEIEEKGINNSQIKILALLMRLRQICCHPGLFLQNYKGESSKLNQCIEIIVDAIKGGHKILLFSGYSSMFEYIEDELNKHGIRFMKLVGQTKVDTRMDLVNKFNEDDDIKVFLISLKAGGTGLNLISADMVIHYDPWWNLSAENQATDRTYRIGQKRNVQVYKLITKNSIEEKIYNLQEKKAKLANDMLSTNEVFLNKLSKDEIMNLFE